MTDQPDRYGDGGAWRNLKQANKQQRDAFYRRINELDTECSSSDSSSSSSESSP